MNNCHSVSYGDDDNDSGDESTSNDHNGNRSSLVESERNIAFVMANVSLSVVVLSRIH